MTEYVLTPWCSCYILFCFVFLFIALGTFILCLFFSVSRKKMRNKRKIITFVLPAPFNEHASKIRKACFCPTVKSLEVFILRARSDFFPTSFFFYWKKPGGSLNTFRFFPSDKKLRSFDRWRMFLKRSRKPKNLWVCYLYFRSDFQVRQTKVGRCMNVPANQIFSNVFLGRKKSDRSLILP